jgi:hypothetical protein
VLTERVIRALPRCSDIRPFGWVILLGVLVAVEACGEVTRDSTNPGDTGAGGSAGEDAGSDGQTAFRCASTISVIAGPGDASPGSWVARAVLSTSVAPAGLLGTSIAARGDVALVGALHAFGTGAVVVFQRDAAGVWCERQVLTASDGAPGDRFGTAVAMTETVAVVGDYIKGNDAGAAYVFRRTGDDWREEAKLLSSSPERDLWFGGAVAIRGNRIAIAASGTHGPVYLYEPASGGWRETEAVSQPNGDASLGFGRSIALWDEQMLIGANLARSGARAAGAAFLYTRDTGAWNEAAQLTASSPATEAEFGRAVAFTGNIVAVGAPGPDDTPPSTGAPPSDGSVHVFQRQATGWSQTRVLTPESGGEPHAFGSALATEDPILVIGDSPGPDPELGHAWVYDFRTGEIQKLPPPGAPRPDRFGASVAVNSEQILVGAPYDAMTGANSGAVYVFSPAR